MAQDTAEASATQFQSKLRSFIRGLPNVDLRPDEMSEEAYFFGLVNFVHFHGPKHIDIRLSLEDQKKALATGKARPHLWAPRAGWISCGLDNREKLADAKELVKRAADYWNERRRGAGEEGR